MKFDYAHSDLREADIKVHAEGLESYRKHLIQVADEGGYSKEESSLNLPFDKSVAHAVSELARRRRSDNLKYIAVIGIGGSNLGAKAIYDALFGYFDMLDRDRFPKIVFLDTVSGSFLYHLENFLDAQIREPEEVAVNVISKSGATTETIANAEFVFAILKRKFGEEQAKKRTIVTTDVNSSAWDFSEEEGLEHLAIPKIIGGRFSVFSAVGIFPLALLGVNTEALLEGARTMCDRSLLKTDKNPAVQSAIVLFHYLQNGKTINDNFIFNPELESLGKWYRQLMGESIGKEKDREGNIAHIGMTPTVSIGSADLHSVGQLYLGGPKDKITTFIWSRHLGVRPPRVGDGRLFPELVPMIDGESSEDIMRAILEGTKTAYVNQGLPFMEVVLDEVNERELGAFLQFKMMEMMYLGKLLNVNTFDQPNVESYKEETRKLLEGTDPDVYVSDKNDENPRVVPLKEAREKKLIRRVVRVFLLNDKKEIYLQLRSAAVRFFPNKWDVSAGGHVDVENQTYEKAAYSELFEELGLHSIKLEKLGKWYVEEDMGDTILCGWNTIYLGFYNKLPIKHNDEVRAGKWFSIEEIDLKIKESPEEFTPAFLHNWEQVRDIIIRKADSI